MVRTLVLRRSIPILLTPLLAAASACGPKDDPPGPDAGADARADGAAPDGWVWPDARPQPDALVPVCGNGAVEGDEVCDDGNTRSGDGCNATCTLSDEWDLVANASFAGDQREPALACDATGVAAVFSDWSGLDGDGAAVRLRLFGTDGRPAHHAGGTDTEFTVNLATADHQDQPRVARLASGALVVVWRDGGGAAGPEIRGRVLAADGGTISGEITVASDPTGEQGTPAVASDAAGGFLVVWADNRLTGPDTSGYGIRGRLFDGQGQPRANDQTGDSGDFQVNQITAGAQIQPDAAWLGDRFLVVWADGSSALDGQGLGIAGALLDRDGAFLGTGTEFLVNSTTAGLQAAPRIGPQPGAGAVVVWTDDSRQADLSHYGIRGRLLALDGTPRANGQDLTTGDFQVNTTFNAGQQLPVPAVLADLRFAVAWQDWSATDGSGASVRARLFTATGAPVATPFSTVGDDFQVNTTFWSSQITPALCAAGPWFFALWEDQSGQAPDTEGSSLRFRLLPGP